MVISLVIIFITSLLLSFFEERLNERDKLSLYCLIGFALILTAGLREPGSTPDSEGYEMMLNGITNEILEEATEPSFSLICSILNSLSLGANALFLTYAFISVPIHLFAFWKLSEKRFLILTIYISYYFMMHEMVQIRAGVAAGLFLLAIYYYVEQKKKSALGCILIGIFFHYSATAGLVLFLLKDKLPQWQKITLYLLIPIGLIAYFTQLDLSTLIPEELGGEKLVLYRKLKDQGIEEELSGWPLERNILIWMNIILFYASIFYSEFLVKHCKYVLIAIKIQAVGFCFLFFMHGVSSVLGNRMNDFFSIANIILWTACVYAFHPRHIGLIINNLISSLRFVTSMLGYALSLLYM